MKEQMYSTVFRVTRKEKKNQLRSRDTNHVAMPTVRCRCYVVPELEAQLGVIQGFRNEENAICKAIHEQ